MKRIITLGVLLSITLLPLQAARYFVKTNGSGDGTSWEKANSNLAFIMGKAAAGDEIWVANGTYYPTHTTDRNLSFELKDGVVMIGGFAGNETQADQRNLRAINTILSGNIGDRQNKEDNSFTILMLKGVSAKTTLDGFVLQDGMADDYTTEHSVKTCGAAIYNDGSQRASSPTILNCVLRNNFARYGAGIYNYAGNGVCEPTILSSTFISNKAELGGGGMYNNGANGRCNAKVERCNFIENEGNYGAAAFNAAGTGQSNSLFNACQFSKNYSMAEGPVMYSLREGPGEVRPVMNSCIMSQNDSILKNDIAGSSTYSRSADTRNVGY